MKKRLIAMLAVSLLAAGCDKQEEATPQPATAEQAPAENAEAEAEGEGAAAEAETEEAPAEEATVATVGKPAPDFELTDQEGNKHKLSDLKGSMVVLEWTNPECPVVQRVYDANMMQAAIKDAGADVKWLAIDSSNFVKPETTKEWMKKNKGMDWPTLQDPTGEVGRAYGAKTTPHMYVIDKEGVLRYNGAIDNDPHGKLDAKERKNYVVEAVKSLAAGKEVADAETKPYGCSVKYAGS